MFLLHISQEQKKTDIHAILKTTEHVARKKIQLSAVIR